MYLVLQYLSRMIGHRVFKSPSVLQRFLFIQLQRLVLFVDLFCIVIPIVMMEISVTQTFLQFGVYICISIPCINFNILRPSLFSYAQRLCHYNFIITNIISLKQFLNTFFTHLFLNISRRQKHNELLFMPTDVDSL